MEEYGFRVIRTENRGLSSARNTGTEAASGDIVAFTDDDAYPDPHWLTYLAVTFLKTAHAGVGGPNIAPPGDGDVAESIANAPGGPTHVLLSDVEADRVDDGIPATDEKDARAIVERLIAQTQCSTPTPAPTRIPTSSRHA